MYSKYWSTRSHITKKNNKERKVKVDSNSYHWFIHWSQASLCFCLSLKVILIRAIQEKPKCKSSSRLIELLPNKKSVPQLLLMSVADFRCSSSTSSSKLITTLMQKVRCKNVTAPPTIRSIHSLTCLPAWLTHGLWHPPPPPPPVFSSFSLLHLYCLVLVSSLDSTRTYNGIIDVSRLRYPCLVFGT